MGEKGVVAAGRRTAVAALGRLEKPLFQRGILKAWGATFPDFIGIGAMKSGTTWLYENLRHHPEIFLPHQKELYYFSLDFHRLTLYGYARKFREGKGRVKGEITPGYSALPRERIRFIAKLLPELKILLLLRDPVERTWSEAFMNLVAKRCRPLERVSDQEFLAYFDSTECRLRSDYPGMISRWGEYFPAERMFVGFFEEIASQPEQLLRRLFGFLSVKADVDLRAFPCRQRILPRYETHGQVHGGVEALTAAAPPIPDRFRHYLEDRYAGDVALMERLFGSCVVSWKREGRHSDWERGRT